MPSARRFLSALLLLATTLASSQELTLRTQTADTTALAFHTMPQPLDALPSSDWGTFVERYADLSLSATSETDANAEDWLDDLYELRAHPLNLNDLDERRLRQLPFLDEADILELLHYTATRGPLLSLGELQLLPTLSATSRELLSQFCYVGPPSQGHSLWTRLWSQAQHDLSLRTDFPLATRVGFAARSADYLAEHPNSVYRGSQPYLSFRYALTSARQLEAGLLLEKDSGESGLDYWSAYAVLHDLGPLTTLAVGCFRASFGYGLAMNTGAGFGKIMSLNALDRMDRGLRRHSSMSESGYLRGVGATVRLARGLLLTGFASSLNTDATLRSDSTGASSLKTDGLHRTLLEQSKKGNITKTDFGGNLSWQAARLRLSLTAVSTHFSLPLLPKADTPASYYRLYNARGQQFTNVSLAYRYVARRWTLGGETAMGQGGGVASLLMAQGQAGDTRLTFIGRYYQASYVSINGRTFSENSRPQNESGLYVGVTQQFSRRVKMEGYVDVMYFPWWKYQVSSSSWGVDAMLQGRIERGRHLLSLRWHMKSKQRDIDVKSDDDEEYTFLAFSTTHSLRLQDDIALGRNLALHVSALGAATHRPDLGAHYGYGLNTRIGWGRGLRRGLLGGRAGRRAAPLRLNASLAWFHTYDYASRLYVYEPSLPYTFGMRALYGQGLRATLVAQLPLLPRLSLTTRLTALRRFDVETIGTGLDEVLQNHREDIQLQLRWQF